ncbi:MAG TPA: hypothetical protein VL179_08360, partial [Mycobacterium sp.]|nr:hypothetical protein [Mycobacterium sp.]
TVRISLLAWEDVIDRTAIGFDQLKPPGLAEVSVLGANGRPVAPADSARNRARRVSVDCGHGPIIAIAGRFVHTSITTTVGALLDDEPVQAQVCDRRPIALPPGEQELLISPGPAFVVDGATLSGPLATPATAGSAATPAVIAGWGAAEREVTVPESAAARVLTVPESINPGWVARTQDGGRLVPVAVNGWQQGWVLPAGTDGPVTLTFGPNQMYRLGMAGGLALLPLLALLAWWPPRRTRSPGPPAQAWRPGRRAVTVGALLVGTLISGLTGAAVFGAALGLLFALRHRQRAFDAARLGCSAGGLILAGAVLCRHPWRSVEGYAGHSAGVQLAALVSVAVLVATAVVASTTESGAGGISRLRGTGHRE